MEILHRRVFPHRSNGTVRRQLDADKWFRHASSSQDAAPLDDSDQNHHNGNNQQDVNEAAQGGTGHQTKDPEKQQNNGNGH